MHVTRGCVISRARRSIYLKLTTIDYYIDNGCKQGLKKGQLVNRGSFDYTFSRKLDRF